MLDRIWHFEQGEYWDYSDVASWRWGLRYHHPWPPDPIADLLEVLRGGQVPLIGVPVQPNVLWPKERQEEFLWKERVGRGPKRHGMLMPARIPPEYLAEVGLRVEPKKWGGTELWWNCGLLAWRFVHFARDELVRAYMAHLELPPVAAVPHPPPQSSDVSPDILTSRQPLGDVLAFEADTPAVRPLLSKTTLKQFLQHRPLASSKQDHKDARAKFPAYNVPREALVVPVRIELGRHRKPGRPEKAPGVKDR